jgi:PAS domain S-box-containing protein
LLELALKSVKPSPVVQFRYTSCSDNLFIMMNAPSQPPQYILLVAPDPLAETLSATLTYEGYHVVSTDKADTALDMHRHYRPSLTILDCGLRKLDAVVLCQQMQEEQSSVLCILGQRQHDLMDRLLAAGASDVISTPIHPRLLRQRVWNLLRMHHTAATARYRLLESIMDAALICDLQGRVFTANQRFYTLSGYDALVNASIFDLFLVENDALPQMLEGLTDTLQLEARLRRNHLAYLPIQAYVTQMDDGRQLWTVRDTSEQQQANITLQESEHRYRDLFNAANDAILIVDIATGRFLNVNKLAARWLGYSREELLGLNFEVIDVPMSEQQQEQVRRELSTTGRLIYEQFYRARDGTLIPVEVSSRLIRYEGRRAFLCFARDITRRRQMEEAERAQRLLAEALSASAAALNSSLDFDQIIEKMLDLIRNVISTDAVNFMRVEGESAIVIGQRGYDLLGLETRWNRLGLALKDAYLMRWMGENQRPLCIPDTRQDERWFSTPLHDWIRSYVGAPIIVGGELVGFLNLDGTRPYQFNEQHAETLMAFAHQAGIALQNARLYNRVQAYADELEQRVAERTADLEQQIQERQRIEKSLADERNLLRTLIDTLPDDVYVKDLEGRYLLLNQVVYERLKQRKPHHMIIGGNDHDFMPRQNADVFRAEEEAMYRTGKPILNQEFMTFDADGGQRWLLVTKVPLRDQDGRIIGLVGVNRDITALRGAEEQLAYVVTGASCLLWYAVVEHRDGALVWDMHISSDAAARRFLPLEEREDESYASALERSILPEEWARMRQTALVALLNNYNGYSHEFRVRRADGQTRWLYEEVRVRPLVANRWSLIGVATDITDRKEAAQTLQNAYDQLEQRVSERTAELQKANQVLKEQIVERRRIENALRESEARFRALVEHAPEAIVVFDAQTERFIDVNENAVRLFGMTRGDLLARGPADFCPAAQPDGRNSIQTLRDKVHDAVNGETPVFEWVFVNTGGREIPCEMRLLLLPTSGTVLIRGSITDISERRTAQIALRESEEKYRSLTNQLPIGVYRTTVEGKLLFGNPALATILGFEHLDAMIGISVLDFYTSPDVRHHLALAYQSKKGKVVETENRLVRRDGKIIWVRDTGRAIFDDMGKVVYIDGTLEDITERVSIQQAEQEQRMFAEALRDAAADLNRTLELEEVLDRMLKYIMRVMPSHESASIMLIEDDQEHVRVLRYRNHHPQYRALPRPVLRIADVPNWNNMYYSGQPVAIPDTNSHPEWAQVFESSKAIRSYVGAPIRSEGQVIGFINLGSSTPNVFKEAHGQRLMSFANQVGIAIQNAHLYEAVRNHARELEKRVAERTGELENERTRLRAILDAMTEGVIYLDENGSALYTNRSLSRITGFSQETLRDPKQLYRLFDGSPEEIDALQREIYVETRQQGIWHGKVRLRRENGDVFDGSIVTTNVTNAEGVSIGSVTVLRDISRETQLEEQKKRFIAVASHELRTPLTNLKTRLYLIQRQPERLSEHLVVMESVTDRMRKLVEDLFDVSRFEHGIIPLKPEITELQQLIYNVIDVQMPEADRKNIRLEPHLPDLPLYALVDPPRLTQVLTNLITNAIHYTPAGGSVRVEAEAEAGDVLIRVRDTGVGIPESWLEQIFQPFFRGHEHSTGAGLGLSITREIVELHGGSISVQSSPGAGTCFEVRLRLAQPVETPQSAL